MSRIQRVILGFTYIFLVMTSYYILKPVRESFFLGEKGYRNLPKAHLLVMVVTFVTVLIYTRASRRLGPARLVTVANLFFIVCISGFWFALQATKEPPEKPSTQPAAIANQTTSVETDQSKNAADKTAARQQVDAQTDQQSTDENTARGQLAWVYFCWVSVFAVFAVTLFWSVIHTVFSTEEGAKSYGIIGAGATTGAMSGGWLTQTFAQRMGTENLLLLAVGLLVPCLLLGRRLAKLSADPTVGKLAGQDDKPESRKPRRDVLRIFRHSPYLCVLGLIVLLTVLVSVFDDYRYGEIINRELTNRDLRTQFYGSLYFQTNLIGLVFSLVLTGPIQARWGPRPGILMFAFVVMASGAIFLVRANQYVVFYSAVALQSVGYSIYQWSRELLYTTTTHEEKFVAKGFIDTFLFRAGAGTAALCLLAAQEWFPSLLDNAVRDISFITLPLAVVLAGLGWWISGQFHAMKADAGSKV